MDEQKIKLFDAIFENSQLIVIGLDIRGCVLLFNPASERVSGYRRDEVMGKNIWEFLVSDKEREKTLEDFADFKAGITTEPFESTWVTKSGEERLIAWNTSIIAGEGGQPEMGLGLGVDITEFRQAEEATRASEERYRTLYSSMKEGLCLHEMIYDESGRAVDYVITDVNPAYENILGISREEAVGSKASQLYGMGEPPYLDVYAEVAATGRPTYFEAYFPPMERHFSISVFSPARSEFATIFSDITERKRAEIALAHSEEHLRLLIGNALDLITVVKDDGTIGYVSPSVKRLLGYDHDELVGKSLFEYIHPDDKRRSISDLDFAMGRPGVTEYAELRVRHKDGSWRVHEASSCNLLDNPVLKGIVINSRDVTERNRAEEELLRTTSELESVFRALPDLYFRVGLDGTIVDYRAGEPSDLYIPPEGFMGRRVQDVLPPEAGERIINAIREVSASGSLVSVEYELPLPAGGQVFEARLLPLLEEGVVAVIRNITERKRSQQVIEESERNYRITFESTGTAMIVIGTDGTILDANKEIQRLLGYTREEVVGKRKYTEFIHPEDLEMAKRYSLQLLRGELEGPIQYEARTIRGDGSVINTLVYVSVLPGINKSVASVLDITEKKSYESELETRAEKLRDFLDIAAHELRHPASLLKGYAMVLEEYGGEMGTADIMDSLGAIERSVDKLTSVVDDLMDVSHIERGPLTLTREHKEVLPLVNKAVEDMMAKEVGNPIRVHFSEDLDTAWLDSDKILRLMIILLDNAVKYSPQGSPIEVSGETREGEVLISVKDRGVGIPEEDRETIFNRFYQVGYALHHSSPGLGLGLYIGKRIVEAHGGRIWYEPREGGGSIFRFSLPV